MTQELAVLNTKLDLWECPTQLQEVKEIYGKNLTTGEFKTLIHMGKATGLNPFLKELWAIKYGDSAAQIFIGRDGFRKSAQANPNYDYHHVDAVYSNDELHYDLNKGEVYHKQDFKNRGNLLGAYCIVKRKSATKPVFVFVDLKEYTTGKSLWASKPATMIKKVAEAQCLRMAFQELFGGAYSDAEIEEKNVTPHMPEIIEGVPLSQQNRMPEEELTRHLNDIANALDKKTLQDRYMLAKEAAKGDKISSNKVSIATKARLEELKQESIEPKPEIASKETTEEFLEAYGTGEENVSK